MPEVFQSLKNSYDKTYPLLLFKLLKTLENICDKKINPTDKYENLISSIENENYLEALKMGVAAGSASAFSRFLATKKEIIELKQQI